MTEMIKSRWKSATPPVIIKLQKILDALHASMAVGSGLGAVSGLLPAWVPLVPFFAGVGSHFLLRLFTEEDNRPNSYQP